MRKAEEILRDFTSDTSLRILEAIRAAQMEALDAAAKVAREYPETRSEAEDGETRNSIAEEIRALKEGL